jgi:cytochrome c peroxidase
MKKLSLLLIITFLIGILNACKKDSEENTVSTFTTTPYTIALPGGFPPVTSNASDLTVEGIQLGHMLYYDSILSTNGLKCASCHRQDRAFSSPMFTHWNGDVTSVPAHVNLAWKKDFLWEGAINSIENVCILDFEPEFFNTNMELLVTKLMNHPQYPEMFRKAYNINDISKLSHQQLKLTITNSIAQFINTFTSSNSKYDKYVRNEVQFTSDELRGYIIFNTEEGDCFHCHGSVLFTDNKHHNNGLDEFPTGQNLGYYNFTHDSADIGKFNAPTLRNVEFTAPYMHDGRFQSLDEVVEFYNSGVNQHSPNIDPIMTKPFKLYGLHLSTADKLCLVDFLKTLSDSGFITNPAYSNPF